MHMTYPFLIAFLLFAYKMDPDSSFDNFMSPSDQKRTGVEKLSQEEKMELQKWINSYCAENVGNIGGGYPSISEIFGNGTYIRLSDDSLWKIDPHDTPITQSWITPVEIIVENKGTGEYPYQLTNTLTGSAVRAQSVKELPPYLLHPPEIIMPPPSPPTLPPNEAKAKQKKS